MVEPCPKCDTKVLDHGGRKKEDYYQVLTAYGNPTKSNGERFGIDPGFNQPLKEKFVSIGLGDLIR